MNRTVTLFFIAGATVITILSGIYLFTRAVEKPAPEISTIPNNKQIESGIDLRTTVIPTTIANAPVTLNTCPPDTLNSLSPDTIVQKPEPSIIDDNTPGDHSPLGLAMEKTIKSEPYPPTDFQLQKLPDQTVQGSWSEISQMVKRFRVYLKPPNAGWNLLGEVPREADGTYMFTDSNKRTPGTYEYAITAVDVSDKESSCSASHVVQW